MSDRQELWRLPRKTLIDRIEQLEAQRNAIAGADESARDKYEKRIERLEAVIRKAYRQRYFSETLQVLGSVVHKGEYRATALEDS
jgi:hypothetical protein